MSEKVLNTAIKVLSYQKEHGKFKSIKDIPEDLMKLLKDNSMNLFDMAPSMQKIDNFNCYLKSFMSQELIDAMGYDAL